MLQHRADLPHPVVAARPHALCRLRARLGDEHPGEPRVVATLPFAVRLDAFEIDYYEGTRRPAQFRSRVRVEDHGRETPAVIQMNQEQGKRAALWGLDRLGTREAAELFVKEGLLDRYLDLVWRRPA